MRIALVTDAWHPQINGVVRTWTSVQEEVTAAGHSFTVVHPGLFRQVPLPRYPEIKLALFPRRGLGRHLRDFDPEAVHIATEGPLGLAGRRWCKRHGMPFTTSFHTHFAKYGRRYFFVPESWTFRLLRWFHGPAKATLVPTPSVVEELTAHGFRNLVTWTRGVETNRFRPRDTQVLPDLPRPIFTYCGRVAREKNIEAFLKADLPGTKLVIGDGPARASLEKAYPDAHWAGYKTGEPLAEYMAEGDVFVFPSRTDTFGVVMLEAMACGLPVAAYPVSGPIDVVRQGETGILDEDIAVAARKALELDSHACRCQALEYSWARCAEIFLENLAQRDAPSSGDAPDAVAVGHA